MTCQVEIIETLSRTVEVQAAGAEDAERLVRDRYRAGEIVLGGDDCGEWSIKAIREPTIYVYQFLENCAIYYTNASNVAILVSFGPVVTALMVSVLFAGGIKSEGAVLDRETAAYADRNHGEMMSVRSCVFGRSSLM